MKNTILEDLFCGRIDIAERDIDRESDLGKANRISTDLAIEFLKIVPECDKNKFNELLQADAEEFFYGTLDSFKHGFKLGIKLMLAGME
ncbi:MAG: hypothetical protein BGN88_10480 [Clostridiales bacterium 43-6]|nr:MAG: hypothetical protein BGN88_10480 [Clostridiales bacterium 43-6]